MKITKENLEKTGGNYWEGGEKKRVYFNDIESMIEIDNKLAGEMLGRPGSKISKTKTRKLRSVIEIGKIWYDLNENKFMAQGYDGYEEAADIIFSTIESNIA